MSPSRIARRTRLRVAAAAALALAAGGAAALAPSSPAVAAAGILGGYTVTGTPTSTPASSPALVKITVKNNAGSIARVGKAVITLPASFSSLAVGTTVKTSTGTTWNLSRNGRVVTATGPGLSSNQSVTVPILATPTTQGTFVVDTVASTGNFLFDLLSFTGQTNSDPSVAVGPPQPAGDPSPSNPLRIACSPNTGYPDTCSSSDSGTILQGGDVGTGNNFSTYEVALNPGPQPDVLEASTVTTPEGDPDRMMCQLSDTAVVFDSDNRSKTITETRFYFGSTDVCFGTPTPFLIDVGDGFLGTAYFNPSTGRYEDRLPRCSQIPAAQQGNFPCIQQVIFPDGEGFPSVVYYAPPGDPRGSLG